MPRTRRYNTKRRNNNTKRHFNRTSDEMKKGYRPRIARQIQSADHRYDSQVLKFSKQMSFVVKEQAIGTTPESYFNLNNYIIIEGNNIMNILKADDGPGAHNAFSNVPTNPSNVPAQYPVQVTSYGDWKDRYDSYRVLSSRITVTWKQTETNCAPALAYIVRTNDDNLDGIDTDSEVYDIKKHPHLVMNTMIAPNRGSQPQTRLFMTTSCKKEFGVKDVKDNKSLSAEFKAAPTTNQSDLSGSKFKYVVGLVPALGAEQDLLMGIGKYLCEIKVEYVTQVFGSTLTNIPQ